MSDTTAESEAEQEELERRLGWYGAGCPCEGHQLLRQEALVEIRAGAPPTPERVFVRVERMIDPDEPAHTHSHADGSFSMASVMLCIGCQYQSFKAAEYYALHPEERPDWLVNAVEALSGPHAPDRSTWDLPGNDPEYPW